MSRPITAAVVLLLSGCTVAGPTATVSPNLTAPSATSTATPSVSPSPAPRPSSGAPVIALGSGQSDVFPATYSSQFLPAFLFTVGDQVDLDCQSRYDCRGEVFVNQPDWLGIGFGNAHSVEFNARLLDKVFDPTSLSNVIDAPADIANLIATKPGVEVLRPATPVTVGGLTAIQFDARTGPGIVTIGPSFELPNEHPIRIIIVTTQGHTVLLTEEIGEENSTGDFDAALASLQPLVDSIAWR